MRRMVVYKLPVSVFKEGRRFIAYTPALDLSTSGKTFEEVKKRFEEAVGIFFEEIVKMGTQDEALADLGWAKLKAQWQPPLPVAHDIEEFKVPIRV